MPCIILHDVHAQLKDVPGLGSDHRPCRIHRAPAISADRLARQRACHARGGVGDLELPTHSLAAVAACKFELLEIICVDERPDAADVARVEQWNVYAPAMRSREGRTVILNLWPVSGVRINLKYQCAAVSSPGLVLLDGVACRSAAGLRCILPVCQVLEGGTDHHGFRAMVCDVFWPVMMCDVFWSMMCDVACSVVRRMGGCQVFRPRVKRVPGRVVRRRHHPHQIGERQGEEDGEFHAG